jgi:hypothetical protein
MCHELNVLALVKGAERFVFVYDDSSQGGLLEAMHDLASRPDSGFTWFDVLVLTKKAREQAAEMNSLPEGLGDWPLAS